MCSQFDKINRVYLPDKPFDDEFKDKIDSFIKDISDVHIIGVSMRTDVLEYILLNHHDLDNPKIQDDLISNLADILQLSGCGEAADLTHRMTLFLIDFISGHWLEQMLAWRNRDHGTSLIHHVYYGHDEVRCRIYVNMLLDLSHPVNIFPMTVPNDREYPYIIQFQEKTGCVYGQSPVLLAALNGDTVILKRFLDKLPNLNTYGDIYVDNDYHFIPMIPIY